MNSSSARLVWSDFVDELQSLLRPKAKVRGLFIVGGAVRDAYMRGAVTDIDIAVDGDAIKIARRTADLLAADIYIMDRQRGVARVFVKREPNPIILDFARFRGHTLHEDLSHRDFTVNAMAADLLGDVSRLIDPLGGERDLAAKVLRRCSPHSIADDSLRALRAVRQSVQLGLKIHPDTLADIRQCSEGLRDVSPERIRDEFFKLLSLDNASRGLRAMKHIGLLRYVLPGLAHRCSTRESTPSQGDSWAETLRATERMAAILKGVSDRRTDNSAAAFDLGMLVIQLDRFRAHLQQHLHRLYGSGRRHRELLMLASLLHREPSSAAASIAKSLKLTHDEGRRLSRAIDSHGRILDQEAWPAIEVHRFWYAQRDNGIDAILLAMAVYLGARQSALRQADWLAIVERAVILLDAWFNQYERLVNPAPLLNGDDIMRILNIEGGPRIGRIMKALREAQVLKEIATVAEAETFILGRFSS